MSMVLDAVVCARGVQVAALCRVTLVPLRHGLGDSGGGISVWAEKLPLAILLFEGGELRCFSAEGGVMEVSAVEALMPGVVAEFRDRLSAGDN